MFRYPRKSQRISENPNKNPVSRSLEEEFGSIIGIDARQSRRIS